MKIVAIVNYLGGSIKEVARCGTRRAGTARGLEDEEPIDGLNAISSAELPGLLENYDQVWHS